jgi:hypothetical protein
MTRFLAGVLAMSLFLAGGVAADDKKKPEEKPKAADSNDPIALRLRKAKESYRAIADKANDALLAEFAKQIKKVEENTQQNVDAQLKLIEQLQSQKRAFEADNLSLPASSKWMKYAVSDYNAATTTARLRCEKAFDTATVEYRNKKDLVSAKAMLEAKQEFIAENTPFTFEGVWACRHSGGWSGRRIVSGDKVIDVAGTLCTWERKKGQLTITWPDSGTWGEKHDIDFKNPNRLKGKVFNGQDSTWVRQP